ncbi:hypothetical protein FACHB389_17370 [Nostoc calcicola FACHB-389]|nr:LamG domain-containing protein [Nostoc calcicola FACHB-3891]OKH33877.1 hypothetical protein FACHB389_17370 [Nostoc calcicola FACHB-389]
MTVISLVGIAASQSAEAASLWNFDEASGATVFDSKDFPNNGTLIGNPTRIPGIVGTGAISFDGVNDYVQVPNDSELNFGLDDFLISAWLKTTSRQLEVIVDKRIEQSAPVQGYSFYIQAGTLGFQLADGTGSNFCSVDVSSGCTNYGSSPFIADGNWHQVAVTVDRDQKNGGLFYVDGNLVNTFDPTFRTASLDNSKALTIGRRSDSSNPGFFNGSLDEVCIASGTDLSVCNTKKSVPESSSAFSLWALVAVYATFHIKGKQQRKAFNSNQG